MEDKRIELYNEETVQEKEGDLKEKILSVKGENINFRFSTDISGNNDKDILMDVIGSITNSLKLRGYFLFKLKDGGLVVLYSKGTSYSTCIITKRKFIQLVNYDELKDYDVKFEYKGNVLKSRFFAGSMLTISNDTFQLIFENGIIRPLFFQEDVTNNTIVYMDKNCNVKGIKL